MATGLSVTFWFLAQAAGRWGAFRRQATVPFVPAVGQLFRFTGDAGVWEVRKVSWEEDVPRLVARLTDVIAPDENWQDLVASYMDTGWEPDDDMDAGEQAGNSEEPPPGLPSVEPAP